MALLLEHYGSTKNIRGPGLGGAIVINYCGGLTLPCWLLFYPLNIPLHDFIILWVVTIIVLVIGVVETFVKSWRY